MARKDGWDKQVVIGEVQKSASTLVRVSYVEAEPIGKDENATELFRGVDVREMFKKKGETEYSYSQKGFTVPIDKLMSLKNLLTEAGIEATKSINAEKDKAKKKKRTTTTRKKVAK